MNQFHVKNLKAQNVNIIFYCFLEIRESITAREIFVRNF
jgi:hypothetical protein